VPRTSRGSPPCFLPQILAGVKLFGFSLLLLVILPVQVQGTARVRLRRDTEIGFPVYNSIASFVDHGTGATDVTTVTNDEIRVRKVRYIIERVIAPVASWSVMRCDVSGMAAGVTVLADAAPHPQSAHSLVVEILAADVPDRLLLSVKDDGLLVDHVVAAVHSALLAQDRFSFEGNLVEEGYHSEGTAEKGRFVVFDVRVVLVVRSFSNIISVLWTSCWAFMLPVVRCELRAAHGV
jgi:hypothetical protein